MSSGCNFRELAGAARPRRSGPAMSRPPAPAPGRRRRDGQARPQGASVPLPAPPPGGARQERPKRAKSSFRFSSGRAPIWEITSPAQTQPMVPQVSRLRSRVRP